MKSIEEKIKLKTEISKAIFVTFMAVSAWALSALTMGHTNPTKSVFTTLGIFFAISLMVALVLLIKNINANIDKL